MSGGAREVRLEMVRDAAERLDRLARQDSEAQGSVRSHGAPKHLVGDLADALGRLPHRTARVSQTCADRAAELARTAHSHASLVRIRDRAPWLLPFPMPPHQRPDPRPPFLRPDYHGPWIPQPMPLEPGHKFEFRAPDPDGH